MTDYYKDKQQLTDEQIAELAPEGCDFYCYKDGEVFFHNVLGLDVFNSKGESISDDFLDSGEWKKAKPIPRKKFDISEYEFSDSIAEFEVEVGDTLVLKSHGTWFSFDKDDAIALAKHFNLTEEGLK